jgi:hypothetical protein
MGQSKLIVTVVFMSGETETFQVLDATVQEGFLMMLVSETETSYINERMVAAVRIAEAPAEEESNEEEQVEASE